MPVIFNCWPKRNHRLKCLYRGNDFQFIFPVSGVYDNPTELTGASANRNGISYADSLKFAAGANFENPDNSAFFENPLATPLVPQRVDSLEHHSTESPYDNPLAPNSGSGTCCSII